MRVINDERVRMMPLSLQMGVIQRQIFVGVLYDFGLVSGPEPRRCHNPEDRQGCQKESLFCRMLRTGRMSGLRFARK